MSGLTQMPVLCTNEEDMEKDFSVFHDCNKKPESMYTDDILPLLDSSNADDVAKAKEMMIVRTDGDFYLQCHILAHLHDIKIRYLGIQKGKNDIYFDSVIYLKKYPESSSLENAHFPSSVVLITFLTYTPPPPMNASLHTILFKKYLVIPNYLQHENHPEVLDRRVITGLPKNILNIKYIRYSENFNDFQFAIQESYKDPTNWETSGYTYEQINELIKIHSLDAAMAEAGKLIAISVGAPGDEVWGFMKSTFAIRYQQEDNWYCVAYSLASALHFIGGCDHIIKIIVNLASVIDGQDYKFQANMIKTTYNHVFKPD